MVLLDIDMPEMDGFEVLEKIREKNMSEELPVVFLTANTEPDIVGKCIEAGGMDVVEKPFVRNVLLNRIALLFEVIEYRRSRK